MGITRVGSSVTVTGLSAAGRNYRLQYKTKLTDPAWLDVSGDVTATGDSASKTDGPLDGVLRRFYRVELLP